MIFFYKQAPRGGYEQQNIHVKVPAPKSQMAPKSPVSPKGPGAAFNGPSSPGRGHGLPRSTSRSEPGIDLSPFPWYGYQRGL